MTKCRYHENMIDKIIPKLWLGDYSSSKNIKYLKKNNIRHIIRLYKNLEFNPFLSKNIIRYSIKKTTYGYQYIINDIIYYHIPIDDIEMCNRDIIKLFGITNQIIFKCYTNNESILVHCLRGHHRSACVVAAFMLKYLKLNYTDTLKYIQSFRKCALRKRKCMVRGLEKYYMLL